ncbi:MAG: tRNA (adenosine(37)-N6)-dimethylallyltransferase MiaA [Bradymonadaceae bacterium]
MDYDQLPTPDLPRILVVGGPTAVGKSTFAVRAAEALDGEIVGADSVQIYKHVDIGTAKPSEEARERVPHHLIDELELDEHFDAGRYVRRAKEVIADIRDRGKRPIVTGGTGLYLRLLVHGIFEAPESSEEVRQKYEQLADREGLEALHARLEEVDPELADKVDPSDGVRVRRGLEVFEQTGKPLSDHQREHSFSDPNYYPLKIGLIRPRHEIHERINRRFDQMMDEGLLEEYESLIERGHDPDLKPLQALGYRQMGQHLFDDLPLEEAVREAKTRTRRYAKRQISWLRSEPSLQWAMAPVAENGELPERVVADLEAFFEGGDRELEWADVDSYDVER